MENDKSAKGRVKKFRKQMEIENNQAAFENFKSKFPDLNDFFEKKIIRGNKAGDEILFHSFSDGKVRLMFYSAKNATNIKKEMDIERFERFLKNYNKSRPRGAKDADPEEEKKEVAPSATGEKTPPAAPEAESKELAPAVTKELAVEENVVEAEIVDEEEILEKKPQNSEGRLVKVEKGRDSMLEELKARVEEARKNYARKDYETTNTIANLRKLMGKFIKTESKDISDVSEAYDKYKAALGELMLYQTGNFDKKNNGSHEQDQEISELVRFYNQEEKINLFEACTGARAEVWEEKKYGKYVGRSLEYANKFVNEYRKVDWKVKMGVGIVAGLSGAGLVMVGQRVLGGVAAGAGVAAVLESRHRKKESRRLDKKSESIKEDLAGAQNKYELLKQKLQAEIDSYQETLQAEKTKARNRKLIGAVAAVVLGSGLASEIVNWGSDKAGIAEMISSIKETFGLGGAPEQAPAREAFTGTDNGAVGNVGPETLTAHETPVAPETSTAPDTMTAHETPVAENKAPESGAPQAEVQSKAPATEVPPEIEGDVKAPSKPAVEAHRETQLTIEKGSSFQGAIIKELTENGNMDAEEAGKEAHLMYREFLEKNPDPLGKEYNIVHPGAKLTIKFDAQGEPHVTAFEDSSKPGSVAKVPSADQSAAAGTAPASPRPSAEAPANLEGNLQDDKVVPVAPADQTAQAEAPENLAGNLRDDEVVRVAPADQAAHAGGFGINAGELGAGATAATAIGYLKYKGRKSIASKEKTAKNIGEKGKDQEKKDFKKIEKKYGLKRDDSLEERGGKLIKAASENKRDNWNIIKETKFSDMEGNLSDDLIKNVETMNKDLVNYYGGSAQYKKDETVKRWVARLTKISLVNEKPALIEANDQTIKL